MPTTVRSKNLDLLRWLNHTHEFTAEKLAHITNSNYLSKMALGQMEITDHMAQEIEKALGVGEGWLDRENIAILNMSSDDFRLIQLVSRYSEKSKESLFAFLSSLK